MKERTLSRQIQNTSLFVTFLTILFVQGSLVFVLSSIINKNISVRAKNAADEVSSMLIEPLYNFDNNQAIKIAEAFLSSGFISSIKIESSATGLIYDSDPDNLINGKNIITKQIEAKNLLLGSVTLVFSNKELLDLFFSMFLFSFGILLAVFLSSLITHYFLIAKKISGPIGTLLNGLDSIAQGDFSVRFGSTGFTDLNLLASGINKMTESINSKNNELQVVNQSLEQRVQERTEELRKSLDELHKVQDKLIDSGKMSALGRLSAGIAHELNTPLGAIIASNRQIANFFDTKYTGFPDFFVNLDQKGFSLYKKLLLEGLKNNTSIDSIANSHKINQSLMAELEWKNIKHSEKIAEGLIELGITNVDNTLLLMLDHPDNLKIITQATEIAIVRKMTSIISLAGQKATTVVSALKTYLSTKSDDLPKNIDISENLDRILTLMHNMIHFNIKIVRDYKPAIIRGVEDKLDQVWINIIRNALEAMSFQGVLTLRTATKDNKIRVEIEDSGPGIPPEIQDKIFEPFFSTKADTGIGLGLDICQRIIENHNGKIWFETKPGSTCFIIQFEIEELKLTE